MGTGFVSPHLGTQHPHGDRATPQGLSHPARPRRALRVPGGLTVAVAPSLPQTPEPGVAVAFARRPTLGIASPVLAPAARM